MKSNAIKDILSQARKRDYIDIPLEDIKRKYNPRIKIGKDALGELTQSIKENGLLQPVVIDANNNLIAGYRRLEAVSTLGWKTIPAIVYSGEQEASDILSVLENLQRENLSFSELGAAYNKIIKETGIKQRDLAKHLGKPESHVSEALKTTRENPDKPVSLYENRLNNKKKKSSNIRTSAKPEQLELFNYKTFASIIRKSEADYKIKGNTISITINDKDTLEKIRILLEKRG